jgi:hypothetical protein
MIYEYTSSGISWLCCLLLALGRVRGVTGAAVLLWRGRTLDALLPPLSSQSESASEGVAWVLCGLTPAGPWRPHHPCRLPRTHVPRPCAGPRAPWPPVAVALLRACAGGVILAVGGGRSGLGRQVRTGRRAGRRCAGGTVSRVAVCASLSCGTSGSVLCASRCVVAVL